MKFIKWLIEALVFDPLIMLFVWNVIVTAMFNCGKTSFGVCLVISVVINLFYAMYKVGKYN